MANVPGGPAGPSSPRRCRSRSSSVVTELAVRRRTDAEAADPPPRWQAHRIGADAVRPAGRLRAAGRPSACLEPGRLRDGLRLLRDRAGRLRAQPHGRRDRRAGRRHSRATRRSAGGRALTNVVFMGMGEPMANYARGLASRRDAATIRPAWTWPRVTSRSRRSALIRGHPQARRRVVAGRARRIAARTRPGAARAAHPDGGPLSAPGDHRRVPRVHHQDRPPRHVRVLPHVRRQRFARRRRARSRRCSRACSATSTSSPSTRRPTTASAARRATRSLTFQRELAEKGVACTVRVEKGVEISAACGQLRGAAAVRDTAPRRPRRNGAQRPPAADVVGRRPHHRSPRLSQRPATPAAHPMPSAATLERTPNLRGK